MGLPCLFMLFLETVQMFDLGVWYGCPMFICVYFFNAVRFLREIPGCLFTVSCLKTVTLFQDSTKPCEPLR